MKLLHFRFVTDMGQNVTCSRLEDKCNFTGSEQNREGVLVFLFFFFFSGNWQFGFWKWQDKLHAECCGMSELSTWGGTKWLIHFQNSHLNISVPLYPCLWISNIKLANLFVTRTDQVGISAMLSNCRILCTFKCRMLWFKYSCSAFLALLKTTTKTHKQTKNNPYLKSSYVALISFAG